MKIHGKVIETIPKERIVILESGKQHLYLYFQRKDFREFGPYLFDKPYLFVEVSEKKKIGKNFGVHEVLMFYKIVQPQYYNKAKRHTVYFDLGLIKKGVKELINKKSNRMFIDLEFTMPSYYQTMPHAQEILQYGIIIEDKDGNIIFEESSLVKPSKPYLLNHRTLSFLSRKRSDFDNACSYYDFYETLKKCMREYKPKVYAWGKSDINTIELSFEINKVKPLGIRKHHINLMQVIKNYYNLKDEIGLFQTYEQMSEEKISPQQHDAFEDAYLTREVFRMFKNKLNEEFKTNENKKDDF